jgi:hypothetical protein
VVRRVLVTLDALEDIEHKDPMVFVRRVDLLWLPDCNRQIHWPTSSIMAEPNCLLLSYPLSKMQLHSISC